MDADASVADAEGCLPLGAAVRGNHPECVAALLAACPSEPSRSILFANVAGESALFTAEQMNIAFAKRVWTPAATSADHDALALSNAVVGALLGALVADGTPLGSIRHAHDCFARGVCYSEKGK